jgi:hypothetical protein
LGAGASVSAGLPALSGIFEDPAVAKYLALGASEFERFLAEYVWTPRQIAPSDRWRSLNLEEVLTMLRLWESDNQSPLNWAKNHKYQKQLLGCVYHSVYVDKADNGCRDYNRLIKLCDAEFDDITWASFNWDAKFEQAFYYALRGLGEGARLPRCHAGLTEWEGTNSKHLYLKLHGSVSWFREAGGKVINMRFGKVGGTYPVVGAWNDYLNRGEAELQPMIAEPSFFKHEGISQNQFLHEQWCTFDKSLGQADVVLIIGYSLPDGDAMAKQSLLTAVARNPAARFIVVDPADTVFPRYLRILGENRLDQRKTGFTEFLRKPGLLTA